MALKLQTNSIMKISYIPFTELVSEIIDNRGRTCPTSQIGIPLIATNCIKNNGLYPSYETVRYVSEETYKTWFRGHPQPGDLIFVTKGSPGRVCVTPNPVNFCIAQDMVAVRADESKVYPKYLFAVLRSEDVQKKIENMHVGTLIPHFKKGDFHKLLLPVPDKEKQILVGDIYYNISDKIELNRRMNETLEAIARALFKAWFIDFEPVRANMENRPSESASPEIAKLFPSEFENGIPKGWRWGKVKDVCKVNINALSNKDTLEVIKYIEISEVLNGVVNNISLYKKGEEPSRAKRKLSHGDVVISTVRPDRGSYFMAFHPEKDLIASTGFAVFTAELVPFSFLYIFLTDAEQLTYYGKLADGAAYPAINQSVIMDIDLIIPSDDLLKQFHSIVEPMFARIAYNLKESKSLAPIRDSLLPRLISGKLPISKIENEAKGENE